MSSNQPHPESLAMLSLRASPFVQNQASVSSEAKAVFSKFRDLELDAYVKRTPYATAVMKLLVQNGGSIVNDHVALRTFKDRNGTSGLKTLEAVFTRFGYQPENPISIPLLKLECRWYEPPQDTNWPKVFISEQQVELLPQEAQEIIYRTIGNYYSGEPFAFIDADAPEKTSPDELFQALETPPWNPTSTDYERLIELASEHQELSNALQYSAWTLVHAHRWNHFTILLNELGITELKDLEGLNDYVKSKGFPLNKFGPKEIQGSAEKHLKQSSTVANKVRHTFADGAAKELPGSFVEFIERFVVDGVPMRGFLGENAQGIFASTNVSN